MMKRFPPRRSGVLLPVNDRAAAAAGVCMYTACRPSVLALQSATFWAVRTFGARILPGQRNSFALPAPEAEELLLRWEQQVGAISAVAVYRRRQAHRLGLTLVAVREGIPIAMVKLRGVGTAIIREQEALRVLDAAHPKTFRAPRPFGFGRVGDWHWSLQEVVFDRPHRPVLSAPEGLFEEVSALLRPLVVSPPGHLPAHCDLTPWNLRRSATGEVCLYDWEDWGVAPSGADRTYFSASSRAVGGPAMPAGLPQEAIDHHRAIVTERHLNRAPRVTLPARILDGLDEAQKLSGQ